MDRNDRQVVIEKVNFDRHMTVAPPEAGIFLTARYSKIPMKYGLITNGPESRMINYTLIKYYRDRSVVLPEFRMEN